MPDPVYRSVLVTQVVNKVLQRGKKSVAEKIVYDALTIVAEKTSSEKTGDKPGEKTTGDALAVVKRAIDNIKPQLEVKSRRVGGATYQVPVEVRPRRATTLAIRWLVGFARDRRERTMAERLAAELMDANNGIGSAVKRKDDMHKMAESNKAFAHYRW
jgi:small subunit ribosomal protein S7